jgi:chromosome segregation ATPase
VGAAGEKKAGAAGSAATSRRSTVGVGAASPKPVGQRTRTGGSSDSVSTIRAGLSRGTLSSNAAADARKRTPAPGIVTAASRPSTRTSVRSEAHIDSPKILDELTSKLAEKDKEIESLKVSFESTVAELRNKLEGSNQQPDEGESRDEPKDTPGGSTTDYDAIIHDLEAQLLEKAEKLRTVDDELIEAVRIKDEGGEALEALQKELENLRIENEEKLKVTESQFEQTIQDYAAQVEKLQASVSDKTEPDTTEPDTTDADLRSAFEANIQNLQHQVDELTASKADLESTIHTVKSERDALMGKISDLENEILDVKSKLAISETAAKSAEVNTDNEKILATKIQSELTSRETELESARKAETELQNTISDIKATLISRDDEISSLKAMHDERMKQLSQDYENEIESLRGDAFFKRKFEELEKQYNELQTSVNEDSQKHTKALAESEERRLLALNTLEAKGLEYEEQLATMKSHHAEELTTIKSHSSETMDAHVKELESVKARCDEQLRLAVADGEATSAEQIEHHEKTLDDLKRLHEEEKQGLLATHQSNLAATSSQYALESAALLTKLEEATAQLEKLKSSSAEEFEASKRELLRSHAADVDRLATAHTEAVASLKEEGLQLTQKLEESAQKLEEVTQKLQELTVAYTHMDTALGDVKAKNASLEEQLSLQTASNANLQASLKTAQEELVAVQAEADDVGQQLALEKVERMTALAELDAVQTVKPDTTAINTLKAELMATTKAFQESLAAAKAELKSVRDDLADMEIKYTATRESFVVTSKDLEELRILSQKKEKTAHADYSDLNDSMTTLVEEANKRVKELEVNAERLTKKLVEAETKYDQLQAQLKIKDAELAEAEVGFYVLI